MISIALCTYNGEKYLRQQLDSIKQQTMLPDELIVCDDCSSDRTLKILQEFKEKVPFSVHIFQNEKNLGSTKNFEKAISLCQGNIIALCDQDDVWKPHKLERLMEALQANPEAGYVFSDAEIVDENLQPLGVLLWDSVGFTGEIKDSYLKGYQFRTLIKRDLVTGATLAFRKDIGKLAMPFPSGGRWIHDGWIALIASATGSRGIPVEEPLIAYRKHSKQQIGVPSREKAELRESSEKISLFEMYRELKKKEEQFFENWEKHGLRITSVIPSVKEKLAEIKNITNSSIMEENLYYLREFETHFTNRRKILTSRDLNRYRLIFQEAVSGRYRQFSDSWRSMFRDIFLRKAT